jgi:hypothetical protein
LLLDRFSRAAAGFRDRQARHGTVRGQRQLDSKTRLLVDGGLKAMPPADTKKLHQAIMETDRAARGANWLPHATVRL